MGVATQRDFHQQNIAGVKVGDVLGAIDLAGSFQMSKRPGLTDRHLRMMRALSAPALLFLRKVGALYLRLSNPSNI